MIGTETLRALVSAGMSAEQILAIAEAMERDGCASRPAVDEQAERRRAADRQRKRDARVPQNVRGTSAEMSADPSPEVSPNDIYSNPHPNPSLDAEASCPPLADRVVKAWNEGPGRAGATDAKPLNADRRKALSIRLREHGEQAIFEAIANLGGSGWHCGQNDRGWRANIGWLLKSPENFQKALELQPAGGGQCRVPSESDDMVQRILRRKAA